MLRRLADSKNSSQPQYLQTQQNPRKIQTTCFMYSQEKDSKETLMGAKSNDTNFIQNDKTNEGTLSNAGIRPPQFTISKSR